MLLRIATLNCLNLALAGRRFYEGWAPYSPDEYIAKTQWLAGMIDRLSADFVLVQEVFHEQALADAVRQTSAGARGWSISVPLAGDDNALPRLGLVWRRSWEPRIDSITELPPGCAVAVPDSGEHLRFSRPLLAARVALPGAAGATTLTLINVHLKSRRPEFVEGEDRDDPLAEARAQLRSLVIRGAEAAALRRVVVAATRESRAPLVVGGDFNDVPGAVTTQIVADTSWKRDDRPQRDYMLFDALDVEQRPQPGRVGDTAFTILHAGVPERIDHVLVSEEFVPQSKHAIGHVAAVEILNDHLVERARLGRPGAPSGPDLTRVYSDHAAVCVSIVLDEKR
jgi:hypothetical protein